MKAYIRHTNNPFAYPGDMKIILAYLHANGNLHYSITDAKVEELYFMFSREKHASDWAPIGTLENNNCHHDVLAEFVDWLCEVNI